ncbi:MAG: hypothetical protein HZB85_01060 [Deltaproteobacteria bacterium]|nr:hypothetical protein [Deltaproteobacteria bacterium]
MKISSFSGRYIVIAASAALLAMTGCGGEKKDQPKPAQDGAPAAAMAPAPVEGAMPAGHPGSGAGPAADTTVAAHTGMKGQNEVKLSKEVMAKWNEVQLEITDSAAKKKATVVVKVGASVPLMNKAFKLKVETFVPDYVINEKHVIESRSNKANNPAVLVALLEGDKVVAKGWVFKSLPDFNSYTDKRYPVTLLGPSAEGGKK